MFLPGAGTASDPRRCKGYSCKLLGKTLKL